MNKLTFLAVSALALAACDKIPFLGGDPVEANASVAGRNSAAPSSNAVADAGVTSSRSLAGLSGAEAGGGTAGKDPAASDAIPASSSQGAVDPRFVGRWSDDGSCKDISELRADGAFRANNGAIGRWRVEGDELVFSGAGGVFRLHVDSIEPDRIVTTNAQGQSGATIRC
jgi:hypothetical protein